MQNTSVVEYESESKQLRSNLWTFCIYPDDSLPDNYLQIINNFHIPTLLSPVHDADISGNGMEKKKHIHVMMHFGSRANKSYDQVMKYVEKLGGCPCEVVHNSVGMIRYFIHKDNPEKSQHSKDMDRNWTLEDIKSFCGFEYLPAFEDNTTDENRYFNFLEEFCEDNQVYNYYQLTLLLKKHNMINELNFLRRHSTHIRFYLTDKYQVLRRLGMISSLDESFANPGVDNN